MATTVRQQSTDQFIDLHFPLSGVDLSQALNRQPTRQLREGVFARTTPIGQNVRAYDVLSNRQRGGQRAGLVRYIATPLIAGWVVQEMALLVGSGYDPPGGNPVQLSNSGRVVTLFGVSQGLGFVVNPGDTTWTATINSSSSTPPLNFTGIMQSAAAFGRLYFADGVHETLYDPSTNEMLDWVASAGALPVDSDSNRPRLIALWRGRIVLAGLLLDPHNWFMSAVGDPTNFDYGPTSISPTQAIAGNNAPQGLIGDVLTGLCPYSDDVLVMFGDHTIYAFRGDPMAGGQIDLISDAIGGAWGVCWAKDPKGTLYFVSNQTDVYAMNPAQPGDKPQIISQAITQLLKEINTGTNTIRLIWDDRFQGLHVFVTNTDEPADDTHFFYEARTGAWWTDKFKNRNHSPLCCVTFDGNQPTDRVPLIGSWDGYVRAIDPEATDDDGTIIESLVLIGPILTQDTADLMVKEVQAVMGETSGSVKGKLYRGRTAELALSTPPIDIGTWKAGRNNTNSVRRNGHALYVGIAGTNPWAIETVRSVVAGKGKVRRRGK